MEIRKYITPIGSHTQLQLNVNEDLCGNNNRYKYIRKWSGQLESLQMNRRQWSYNRIMKMKMIDMEYLLDDATFIVFEVQGMNQCVNVSCDLIYFNSCNYPMTVISYANVHIFALYGNSNSFCVSQTWFQAHSETANYKN